MKTFFLNFTLALLLSTSVVGQKNIIELEFIDSKQLTDYQARFDLSGMDSYKGDIYVIADKKDNRYLYKVNWNTESTYQVSKEYPIDIKGNIDLEGLVFGDDVAYVPNEANNEVYKIDLKSDITTKLPIKWDQLELPKSKWQKNAGFEGIALDKKNNILFLAKERDPRFVLEVDLNTYDIKNQYDVSKTCSNDFADLFFYKGYLYALERNAMCIAKIDITSKEIVAHYSYRKSVSRKKMKLYEPVKYGMAEALMIKDGEIWLGWDNNGVSVSAFGEEEYNLKGNLPVIMKFTLPE